MENRQDNFDKEFSLNKNTKKSKNQDRRKLPSWIMILGGIAVIGGAVAARQPIVRTNDMTLNTSLSAPVSQSVPANSAVFSSFNDQKADEAELEAHFASQNGNLNAQYTEPVFSGEEESLPIVPTETAVPTVPVQQKPASDTETDPTAALNAAENVKEDEKVNAEPAIVRLKDKVYAVSITPQEKTGAADPAEEPGSEASDAQQEKQTRTTMFTVADKEYVLSLTEIDEKPEEVTAGTQPVIWLDETPLQVVLDVKNNEAEAADNNTSAIEVILKPLPADRTAQLQQERFGEAFVKPSSVTPTEEAAAEPIEPTEMPTAVPQNDSWIVNIFNNIFGSAPTEIPTPQVTVIALTPTTEPVQPTATPIVIDLAPTAEKAQVQQGPVRLDSTPETSAGNSTVSKDAVTDDAALWDIDDEENNETTQPTVPANEPTAEPTKQPARQTAERIEAVVLDENSDSVQPSAEPTPEELPHTGMAESWNIPTMLAMLCGLLLVIIGVRRLRSRA